MKYSGLMPPEAGTILAAGLFILYHDLNQPSRLLPTSVDYICIPVSRHPCTSFFSVRSCQLSNPFPSHRLHSDVQFTPTTQQSAMTAKSTFPRASINCPSKDHPPNAEPTILMRSKMPLNALSRRSKTQTFFVSSKMLSQTP